jgi:hypothetical protein
LEPMAPGVGGSRSEGAAPIPISLGSAALLNHPAMLRVQMNSSSDLVGSCGSSYLETVKSQNPYLWPQLAVWQTATQTPFGGQKEAFSFVLPL